MNSSFQKKKKICFVNVETDLRLQKVTKDSLRNNRIKSPHFEGFFFKLPYLDNRFLEVAKHNKILKPFYLLL